MTQQIINIGEVANDGTGESLRTAFEAVNNNFSQIWSSGPVNSNVVIANNVISTTPVNTALILAPGGIGNIQANARIIPGISGVYDLGSANRRWDSTFSNYFYGNGYFLTGIQVANVGSLVNGNSNVFIHGPGGVVTVSVNNTANIVTFTSTSVDVSKNITSTANISANYFVGNGSLLTGIIASGGASIDNGNSNVRISGNAANVIVGVSGVGNVAVFTPTGLQVTNTITAATIISSGNIIAARFQGNGSGLTGIVGSTIVGPVPEAEYATTASTAGLAYIAAQASQSNIANYVTASAQPNITSVGNLVSVTVSGNASIGNSLSARTASFTGNLSAGNANLGNAAQATYFIGNGALLTGIQATVGSRIENGTSNINIPVTNGNITVSVAGTGNVTVFSNAGINVSGIVNASNFQGNGVGLSSITGANVTGNVPKATYAYTAAQAGLAGVANTVIDNAQPNITSVGTLTGLTVLGNIVGQANIVSLANVFGNYFLGNGRHLTGVLSSDAKNLANGTSNINIGVANGPITVTVSNVANTVVFRSSATDFNTNVSITGNVVPAGIKTDNYYYANGAPLDFQPTAGSNTQIQFNNNGVFGASANLTFDSGSSVLSVTGNIGARNITTSGTISSVGNITAPNFIGNVFGNISGNVTVPGANTEIIYNNNDLAGSSPAFTFDQVANVLSVAGNVIADVFTGSGVGLTSTMSDKGSDTNNWNALLEMGTYTVNRVNWGGVSGPPLDSQVYVGLLTVSASKTTPGIEAVQQTFSPGTVDVNNIKLQWVRNYWSGSWTPWVKMVNDDQQIDGGSF